MAGTKNEKNYEKNHPHRPHRHDLFEPRRPNKNSVKPRTRSGTNQSQRRTVRHQLRHTNRPPSAKPGNAGRRRHPQQPAQQSRQLPAENHQFAHCIKRNRLQNQSRNQQPRSIQIVGEIKHYHPRSPNAPGYFLRNPNPAATASPPNRTVVPKQRRLGNSLP